MDGAPDMYGCTIFCETEKKTRIEVSKKLKRQKPNSKQGEETRGMTKVDVDISIEVFPLNSRKLSKQCTKRQTKRLSSLTRALILHLTGDYRCPFLHLKKHSGNKPNLFIQTTKVEKVEGEAYVNVRKGKIIPSYEISLTLGWAGEAKMPPATCCSCNYR
ncbi:hypothetical protein RJ640_012377 [Escallonia rubra]|uniref:Activator of Hsp90 ATPase AHSA1-like N-terminal domain-containing protein n=1 Tax=Escallonia rubra TaxID=112253 RepID=A0AA88R572_9ASTE|nr:hypothetical protein RJ640_012377 [Escallonia rubra]